MRLITHNLMSSNVKGVVNGFPLRIEVEKVVEKTVEMNGDFLKKMFEKIDWKAFVEASRAMGYTELPEEADSSMLDSDEFLSRFHHALLELHLEEGALVCPETGRRFPVTKGIPNMLLHEDETELGITVEKKVASQIDTLTLDESQQAEREIESMSWLEMVGKNRGRVYNTRDMSSHFTRGTVPTSFYSTQMGPSASSDGLSSSYSRLHQAIEELWRDAEERERLHQERERLHKAELQRVRQAREAQELQLREMQRNMNEMMELIRAMGSRPPQTSEESSRPQTRHPDYADDDDHEDTPLRSTRHRYE